MPEQEPVRDALLAQAETVAGDLGVALTADGQDTLRSLVEQIAEHVTSDVDLDRGRASVARLVAMAAQDIEADEGTRGASEQAVTGPKLRQTLLGLCPGFWPFC